MVGFKYVFSGIIPLVYPYLDRELIAIVKYRMARSRTKRHP